MAKYCTNCGKKLEKEESCTCKHSSITLVDEMKEFIKSPLDALEKFREKENTYLFSLLASLSFGLLSCLSNNMHIHFFPYVEMIRSMVLIFMALLVFSLVIYGVENTIFKGNITFEIVYGIISKSSIFLFIGNVLTFLFYFISVKISGLAFLFGGLLFVLSNFYGLLKQSHIDKNKIIYLYGLSVFITMLVGCVTLFIL